uniref:Uncharacterized protein n=1 Tax=Sparus aurata TaxID=8175 RepID=A0A671U8X5_SPAAU
MSGFPLSAEARGPSAGMDIGLTLESGARVMVKAELASASVSAGPVKATVGLSTDTGIGIGPPGIEAKVLGTGFTIGPELAVSFLGSEIRFKLW